MSIQVTRSPVTCHVVRRKACKVCLLHVCIAPYTERDADDHGRYVIARRVVVNQIEFILMNPLDTCSTSNSQLIDTVSLSLPGDDGSLTALSSQNSTTHHDEARRRNQKFFNRLALEQWKASWSVDARLSDITSQFPITD